MSGSQERPRSRRRALSAEEQSLWRAVTEGLKPLRGRKRAKPVAQVATAVDPPTTKSSPTREAPVPKQASPRPKSPPPLALLPRREKQRVVRGSVPLDARLDLHGLTQDRAHRALVRFLRAAQADGAKLVLVITGKGARGGAAGEERGILRRLVPQWLALAEFRSLVVGFETAHVTHGGEGALYVRVRRGG